ncbi:MAG TPA: arginine--tRNA ligase, partial [Candidatus Altiarchaeales archaeon]|nr:arginine--tRNA ligase [Candidatus Altiarchaeales archaeon]
MYEEIQKRIRKSIEDVIEERIEKTDVQESEIADFTSPVAFKLARKFRKSPIEVARNISQRISCPRYVQRVEARNGYINFYLGYTEIFPDLMKRVLADREKYGSHKNQKVKIILEHTSINPSGPVHIGRLRNSLIGDSVARILKFCGYDVETHYYVNDIGKQIAIISQGFKEGVEPDSKAIETYQKYEKRGDFAVFFGYVTANRRFESDPEFAERVQESIRKAEGGDKGVLAKISNIAKMCLDGQKEVFKKLGIEFDRFDFESDYIKDGSIRDIVEFLKTTEHWKTTEYGAGLDLSKFGIEKRGGISIILRNDGTSVYLARDIAYHLYKSKQGDRMINVLGEDHKLEFQELKTILTEIYKLKTPLDVIHYSFVNFEGMELSTRKGLTAPIDLLIDEAIKKSEREIVKRGIASKSMAPSIGIGAIKYHILKTSPLKQISFVWEDALDFEGESSPYIQYAHARCCGIIEKSDFDIVKDSNIIVGKEFDDKEKKLIFEILKFPVIIEKSA